MSRTRLIPGDPSNDGQMSRDGGEGQRGDAYVKYLQLNKAFKNMLPYGFQAARRHDEP